MSSENVELPVSKPVRSPRKRLFVAVFIALLWLIPFVRLVWITSQTDTGWETISQQWRDATVGQFVDERPMYSSLNSADRAAFWFRETQRIVAEEPDSAELAMGAAILLDSPGPGFVICHCPSARPPAPLRDNKTVSRAVDKSEDQCRETCLAMAAKATELQPKEPRWWRLRALLLFDCQPYLNRETAARLPDWLDVLQKCREHDPGNALYDYLAAWLHWRESVDTTTATMPIVNQAKFDFGTKYFLRPRQRQFCAVAGGEGAVVARALRRTIVPHIEYQGIADGRDNLFCVFLVRSEMWRIPTYEAERLEKKGDLAGALALRRQCGSMLDQLAQSGGKTSIAIVWPYIRAGVFASLQALVQKHPALVSAEEAVKIKNAAEDAADEEKTYSEANRRLLAQRVPPSPFFVTMTELPWWAAWTTPFLVLAGAIACALARWLRKTNEPDPARLGVVRHLVAWLVGYALTFVIFGIMPALPPVVQNWLFAGLIALLLAAGASWLFWKMVVRRELHFDVRFLLLLTLACASSLGALKTCGVLPHDFSGFGISALSIPARGFWGFPVDSFQPMIAAYGWWYWADCQWMLYGGNFTAIGVVLAIIAVWHQIRLRRINSPTKLPARNRWADRFVCLGRSMLVVAALWMLAYLWLMPTVVQVWERSYHARMAELENPGQAIEALTNMMAEVRAEQSWRKDAHSSKETP